LVGLGATRREVLGLGNGVKILGVCEANFGPRRKNKWHRARKEKGPDARGCQRPQGKLDNGTTPRKKKCEHNQTSQSPIAKEKKVKPETLGELRMMCTKKGDPATKNHCA